VIDRLLRLLPLVSEAAAIPAVFLLTAAETSLLLGFLVPGEVVVILGGFLASREDVSLTGIVAAGILGPIAGDSIGYLIGRRYARLLRGKQSRKRARARKWLRDRGGKAVFLARFVAFLRTFMPAAAGASRMPYRIFLAWSAPAGILWGTGSALLGYFAGRNIEAIIRWTGRSSLLVLVFAAAAAALWIWRRRSRKSRRKA
jgi:membrane-associated protein